MQLTGHPNVIQFKEVSTPLLLLLPAAAAVTPGQLAGGTEAFPLLRSCYVASVVCVRLLHTGKAPAPACAPACRRLSHRCPFQPNTPRCDTPRRPSSPAPTWV